MPSAARQRLPADLWRQGYRKQSSGSPGPFNCSQEIIVHASPGNCDVFQEEKLPNLLGSTKHLTKSPRKQPCTTSRGSPSSLTRRGSFTLQRTGLSESDNSIVQSKMDTPELSTSAKSDSYLRYDPTSVCDAYAMESSIAPPPSEVPLPPLEWLQSYTRQSRCSVISNISLKAILGCQVAA
ncbi:unnamed protein product [Candidula unifasciata]|uniref:Uncharacterized protein n=1 Tax=Candidula unifasciata TaxID=100452 RepID=A0A8S3YVM3_9EUPU|nr:unnamed protein product [Candidula unifasciata]